MFDNLGEKFDSIISKVKGYGTINEENISEMVRDIRVALLEADVNYKIVGEFVNSVKEKSKFIELYANAPQNVIMYQYFKSPKLVDKYIVGNNLSFVINDTDINYVLPMFYTISILDNGISNFYIPITPKVLIRLTTEKMICGNTLYFGKMEETDVDNFNKIAIQSEFRNNKGAIYALKEDDLKRYVSFIKTIENH